MSSILRKKHDVYTLAKIKTAKNIINDAIFDYSCEKETHVPTLKILDD